MTSLLLIATLACGPAPLDQGFEGGAAFRLSGEVAPGVRVSGTETRAAIAYAWSAGDVGGVVADEARFEARIWSYAMDVAPPPEPVDGGPQDAALRLAAPSALLVGLPFLYEPDGTDLAPEFEVDPSALLARAGGAAVVPVRATRGARIAAFAEDHLLGAYAGEAPTLGEDPAFAGSCALEAWVAGLTLYRHESDGCGGLQPLAPAGARLEFQGVRMVAP